MVFPFTDSVLSHVGIVHELQQVPVTAHDLESIRGFAPCAQRADRILGFPVWRVRLGGAGRFEHPAEQDELGSEVLGLGRSAGLVPGVQQRPGRRSPVVVVDMHDRIGPASDHEPGDHAEVPVHRSHRPPVGRAYGILQGEVRAIGEARDVQEETVRHPSKGTGWPPTGIRCTRARRLWEDAARCPRCGGHEIAEREGGFLGVATMDYLAPVRRWLSVERRALRSVTGRVLDGGCGAGRVALVLQARGREVVAIDPSVGAVDVARRRGVRDVRQRRLEDMDESLGHSEPS